MTTDSTVAEKIWTMTTEEREQFDALPATVRLWRVRIGFGDDHDGTYYLNRDAGLDGLVAAASSCEYSIMEDVALAHARIVAVDAERQTAQVVL